MQINASAQACINVGSAHIPEIPEPHVGVTRAHGRCLYCVHKLLARAFLILNCKTLTICDNHMLNRKLMWKDLREIRRRRWFSGLVSKIRCRRKFSETFDYVSPRKTLLEANSRRALPACQSGANFSPIARQRVSRRSFCSPIGGANNAATLQSGAHWPYYSESVGRS